MCQALSNIISELQLMQTLIHKLTHFLLYNTWSQETCIVNAQNNGLCLCSLLHNFHKRIVNIILRLTTWFILCIVLPLWVWAVKDKIVCLSVTNSPHGTIKFTKYCQMIMLLLRWHNAMINYIFPFILSY